jgi:hypothetical protein
VSEIFTTEDAKEEQRKRSTAPFSARSPEKGAVLLFSSEPSVVKY